MPNFDLKRSLRLPVSLDSSLYAVLMAALGCLVTYFLGLGLGGSFSSAAAALP